MREIINGNNLALGTCYYPEHWDRSLWEEDVYKRQVDDREQLEKVIRYLNLTGWPYFLLGNGSNLLVGDKGYRGVVIRLGRAFENVKMEGNRLTCGAAVSLAKAARTAMENGFSDVYKRQFLGG